jgi:hypothetical protein
MIRKRDIFLLVVLGGLNAIATAAFGEVLGQPSPTGAAARCFVLQTGSDEGIAVGLHITNPGVRPVQFALQGFGETADVLPDYVLVRVVDPRSTLDLSVASPHYGFAKIMGNEPLVVKAEVVANGATIPRSTVLC